jgi:crotonobetainyl-CoA:carnitine CoA-transferase CaiB-like acyl-CoA transferase
VNGDRSFAPIGADLPLAGVRVIEVAEWVFVPTVGAMLADWGADVIKVEHPVRGDGFRGLDSRGVISLKRPKSLERLGLGVDDLRPHNPALVYGRGHGYGTRGDCADQGAFDTTAFWARSGLADAFRQPDSAAPHFGRIAVGDRTAATHLAFGIVAALLKARSTGAPSVVDVSLLSAAMWTIAGDIAPALVAEDTAGSADPSVRPALIGGYRTKDDRFITLAIIQPTLHFAELCRRVGRPDLIEDERFANPVTAMAHVAELREQLEATFASATYAEWCEMFADATFPWAPVQSIDEVIADPQVIANDYIADVVVREGSSFRSPTGVVQFDGRPPPLRRAPGHGADTDLILEELGLSWDEVIELKLAGAVL